MTAPQPRAGGLDANARGIAVLVVAVLIGILLLQAGGSDGAADVATTDATTTTVDGSVPPLDGGVTTTTAASTDVTTTTVSSDGEEERPAAEVQVLVLNGGGPTGVAVANSTTVGEQGYQMLEPGNFTGTSLDTTAVYFAEGYEAEAAAVAEALGKSSDVVAAKPEGTLGTGWDEANVVVVLGKDTPPVS